MKKSTKNTVKHFIRYLCLVTALLLLSSCGLRPADKYESHGDKTETTATPTESTTASPAVPADTETDAPETTAMATEHPVGIYFDMERNGNYTRLTEWRAPWYAGKDIAVFDIIPSDDELLVGYPYKELWLEEAEKSWGAATVRHRFELSYTLRDGTEKTLSVSSPTEAEAVGAEGYVEVYIYDDIHQDGDVWYSHLTEADLTESTVFSSIKLTAGANIAEVEKIVLHAYSATSTTPSSVELIRID